MHTSLGHLIRPICLRTRRSLSLSSCSSPVWPSLPEGWGGTNTTLHKCVPPQYLPLPNLKKKWWWKCVFHLGCSHCARIIKSFHGEAVSQGMFMTTVKLVFSLECWLVPNPSQDQNNRWRGCQGEERREVQRTGESLDLGIPVEWTSCVFSCVNTEQDAGWLRCKPSFR